MRSTTPLTSGCCLEKLTDAWHFQNGLALMLCDKYPDLISYNILQVISIVEYQTSQNFTSVRDFDPCGKCYILYSEKQLKGIQILFLL